MRKLILAALLCFALGSFLVAGVAYAGDCCGAKTKCCKQDTCSTCKKPCDNKCGTCKPKCESGCKQDTCSTCKSKCKQDTCSTCKPKCKPACSTAKPCGKCDKCKQDTCTTCKPKCKTGCQQDCCKSKCGDCCGEKHHPYESCFTGSSILCDTGCCNAPLICKRQCLDCETVCKKVETTDPCTGCVSVSYTYETVCHEVKRPRVIPWWFNEAGTGNIYPDDEDSAAKDEG